MKTRTKQRLDIQGLRAVAVLAVVAAHVTGRPAGGFVGVDVFFVISGFLITSLLLRESDRTGTVSFSKFYERRVKRIIPAALVVIVATVVASFVLIGPEKAKVVTVDALLSLLFVGNWRFATEGVDYFALGTTPSPLQHFWSLGVEEQFYLVWPWIMLLVLTLAARRSWSSQKTKRLLFEVIAGMSAASFIWALLETQGNSTFAYFSTLSRAWELGVGALLAFLPTVELPNWLRSVLSWGGLLGILASLIVIEEDSAGWPAPLALLPVLSAALVLFAGATEEFRAPWVLTNPISRYLGDISYSLYLWHFPVAILTVTIFTSGTISYYVGAIALSVVFAIGSYHFIENPARSANWFRRPAEPSRRRARAWLPMAVALVAIMVAGGCATSALAPSRSSSLEPPVAFLAIGGQPMGESSCWGAGANNDPEYCSQIDLGAPLPLVDNVLDDSDDAYACQTPAHSELRSCQFGDEDALVRVALVGDSHATHLIPALEPQLDSLGWRLDTYTGIDCTLDATSNTKGSCAVARPAINEALTSGDFDLVIASSSRRYAKNPKTQAEIIEDIRASGAQVAVVLDNPMPSEESIACAQKIVASAQDGCSTSEASAFSSKHSLAAAGQQAGAAIIDLNSEYCWEGECPAIIGNVRVYRDAWGHVTATWAKTISRELTLDLQSVL